MKPIDFQKHYEKIDSVPAGYVAKNVPMQVCQHRTDNLLELKNFTLNLGVFTSLSGFIKLKNSLHRVRRGDYIIKIDFDDYFVLPKKMFAKYFRSIVGE